MESVYEYYKNKVFCENDLFMFSQGLLDSLEKLLIYLDKDKTIKVNIDKNLIEDNFVIQINKQNKYCRCILYSDFYGPKLKISYRENLTNIESNRNSININYIISFIKKYM